jgi:hypothetical protein
MRAIRFPGSITVLVRGRAMVGLTLTVEMRRGSPEMTIATMDLVVESNDVEVAFTPDETIYLAGEDSVPIYFWVEVGAAGGSSAIYSLDRKGIDRCAWFRAGEELGHETEVDHGTAVELRVFTWGFDGENAFFDIYENDDVGDDYLESLQDTVSADLVSPSWNARFTEDGVFDVQAEYFFRVTIGNRDCQSPRIHVDKP